MKKDDFADSPEKEIEKETNVLMAVTTLSRSGGHNMTAYINDLKPESGKTIHAELSTLENLPAWAKNSKQLWSRVENRETRPDALLARKFEADIPVNLSIQDKKNLCQNFVENNISKKGLTADWSIREHKERFSFSMLVPAREINDTGFGNKSRVFTKKTLGELNQAWGDLIDSKPGLAKKESVSQKDTAFQSMANFAHLEWKMETIASSGMSQEKKIKFLEPLKEEYRQAAKALTLDGESLGISPDLVKARYDLHLDFSDQMIKENVNLQQGLKKSGDDTKAGRKALAINEASEFEMLKAAKAVQENPSIENRQKFVAATNRYTDSSKDLMEKGECIGIPKELTKNRHELNMKALAKEDHLKNTRNPTTAETLAALTIACARQVKNFLKKLFRKDEKNNPDTSQKNRNEIKPRVRL